MTPCIFCQIVSKEIFSHIIYEDNDFLAFIDIHPISPGHTLVIPKRHYRWVWDVPNTNEYFEITKKIALAQRRAFETDAISIKIVGEEIPHAHIWVFPNPDILQQKKEDVIKRSFKEEINDFEGNKKKIIDNL
jgi:histidine triad (HIT) family protein